MDKTLLDSKKTGIGAAKDISKPPERLDYLEARGFLCHELLYLLGGNIEFVPTSKSKIWFRIIEIFFPVFPLCRWYPPEGSALELVGYVKQTEAMEDYVYRFTPKTGDKTIFFVEYHSEPPAWGYYCRPLFKVPRLEKFLRPPFDGYGIILFLHRGDVARFSPPILPATDEARARVRQIISAQDEGMWEVFCKLK